MSIKKVESSDECYGAYSPAISIGGKGDILFIAGQCGVASNGKLADGIKAQTRAALERIERLVVAAGGTKSHVVDAIVLLADMGDFDDMNSTYAEFYGQEALFPTRAAFAVKTLPLNSLIEIKTIAFIPKKKADKDNKKNKTDKKKDKTGKKKEKKKADKKKKHKKKDKTKGKNSNKKKKK